MKRVTAIVKVESVDVVFDPATNKSLRESRTEEGVMDLAELRKTHADLVAQLVKETRDSVVAELKGSDSQKKLEADLAEAKAKLSGYEAAAKAGELKAEIGKLLADSKIPAAQRPETLAADLEAAGSIDGARKILGLVEAQYLKVTGRPQSQERQGGQGGEVTRKETVAAIKGR